MHFSLILYSAFIIIIMVNYFNFLFKFLNKYALKSNFLFFFFALRSLKKKNYQLKISKNICALLALDLPNKNWFRI